MHTTLHVEQQHVLSYMCMFILCFHRDSNSSYYNCSIANPHQNANRKSKVKKLEVKQTHKSCVRTTMQLRMKLGCNYYGINYETKHHLPKSKIFNLKKNTIRK